MITRKFPIGTGYIMKGKTNDSSWNCFTFASGYSLSLKETCTLSLISGVFSVEPNNYSGLGTKTTPNT